MGLREILNEKPVIGRTITVIALVVAGFLIIRTFTQHEPDSIERRSETVTIRDTETGDEWTMNRGQFERLLLLHNGLIDANGGIPSQFSDGRPTGILVDKDDWQETVSRINSMKKQINPDG